MKPFTKLTGKVAAMVALSLIAVHSRGADPPLKTRDPDEIQEIDRDENGKTDTYTEKYVINDELTVSIHERLDEESSALKARVIAITSRGIPIWHDAYTPSSQEHMATFAGQDAFEISTMSSAQSGNLTVYVMDDKGSLVAVLIGEKDGRLAPATDNELVKMMEVGQAVVDLVKVLADQADPRIEEERSTNDAK